MGYLRKMRSNQQSETPTPLYIWPPPSPEILHPPLTHFLVLNKINWAKPLRAKFVLMRRLCVLHHAYQTPWCSTAGQIRNTRIVMQQHMNYYVCGFLSSNFDTECTCTCTLVIFHGRVFDSGLSHKQVANSLAAASFTVLSHPPPPPPPGDQATSKIPPLRERCWYTLDTGLLLKTKRPIRDITTELESR